VTLVFMHVKAMVSYDPSWRGPGRNPLRFGGGCSISSSVGGGEMLTTRVHVTATEARNHRERLATRPFGRHRRTNKVILPKVASVATWLHGKQAIKQKVYLHTLELDHEAIPIGVHLGRAKWASPKHEKKARPRHGTT
jgi:hypothetical protein